MKAIGARSIYISTDYVFDGQRTESWKPDCRDYKLVNVYGRTKLEGEFAVRKYLERYFIVRIAWVFVKNGKNFIKTILNVGKTHDKMRVDNNQIGTVRRPIHTIWLDCSSIWRRVKNMGYITRRMRADISVGTISSVKF